MAGAAGWCFRRCRAGCTEHPNQQGQGLHQKLTLAIGSAYRPAPDRLPDLIASMLEGGAAIRLE